MSTGIAPTDAERRELALMAARAAPPPPPPARPLRAGGAGLAAALRSRRRAAGAAARRGKNDAELMDGGPDPNGDRNQLVGALEKFLAGWA